VAGDGPGAALTAASFAGAVATWLVFGAVAFAMGAARELWLRPRVGERAAHVAGTLAACAAFAAVAWTATRKLGFDRREAVLVGAAWAAAGVLFDLVMACAIQRKPLAVFAHDYRLDRGRLTALLWLTLVAVPWLAAG